MQSCENDATICWGKWSLLSQEVASALAYSDYDYTFVLGEGRHSLIHGGAIFSELLRLWRDYTKKLDAIFESARLAIERSLVNFIFNFCLGLQMSITL